MRYNYLLVLPLLLLLISGCMEMDGFLFNTEKLDHYSLPGNTIPDSLIEPMSVMSGGNRIYGYWVRSGGGRPGLTMLYCHGNKHNIDNYWDRVMYLHRLGVNVLIFDYRGFGMSEGTSSEEGLYEDGEAALDFVTRTKGVPADSLILYGYSLGNVVSIHLAAERITPLTLIAESPFASANSLTQSSSGLDIPPRWLTDGTFDNASEIAKVHVPLLLMQGEDDDFVRYRDNGVVVFRNANEPKRLVPVPGAVHTDVPETMGVENYLALLNEWIATRR
ncbi:MAG: alpha/beta hydrolase [Candidatus Kapaibacterium sp.]